MGLAIHDFPTHANRLHGSAALYADSHRMPHGGAVDGRPCQLPAGQLPRFHQAPEHPPKDYRQHTTSPTHTNIPQLQTGTGLRSGSLPSWTILQGQKVGRTVRTAGKGSKHWNLPQGMHGGFGKVRQIANDQTITGCHRPRHPRLPASLPCPCQCPLQVNPNQGHTHTHTHTKTEDLGRSVFLSDLKKTETPAPTRSKRAAASRSRCTRAGRGRVHVRGCTCHRVSRPSVLLHN